MKTILAAIDHSEASGPVLRETIALAGPFRARVILAHVAEPPMAWDRRATEAPKLMASLAKTSRRLGEIGLTAEARELYGLPGFQLAEEVRRTRPDFIIVGSHAHGVLRSTVLGRTASYLLRHVACPVLLVPPRRQPPARKTILAAFDFTDATASVLHATSELARHTGARVVAAHVVLPPVERLPEESEEAASLQSLQEDLHHQGIEAETRRLYGWPQSELLAEARRLSPDYLVVGSHLHGRLHELIHGDTAGYLLRHAECPIFIVPAGTAAGASVPA